MTDDKTVIPRLLALRSIKLINTERRLTPRKVLCQRSYSSRRPVEGKTVTGSSRKVQEQTSVKQLTTTTKRLKPISGDNKEGVAAASVVQHWLRQLVLDIALRGRINAIPAAVRHADNLPGRGDVSQGMVVSSCSELDKVDDTSIVASNSRGNSEGLRLLTKLGGDGLALSVKDKKAVVDRLRRVLDNKKDGVCDDNQPEVLETQAEGSRNE
ncbi:hypothetical protein Pmar_PMAR029268 [Perkinsus marinus ATCC 50983]|uniref:Uncharacterized protein n=1 Tax=Perkinsus marinus (strain ATCC 50983 / TXsc) TaxID=423536 RepID=C5KMP4_PERM5|nr:hypothetical protein Pmar_PMAR029268 [Perkinsus marinus ATCC 50983]EER14202.1 hypothetical protein Pmar_PMAR029268 [Perkinsus marinus ATCC 50983]|eukprot:XP_002782407.1 hypothetical protein Pmar_PMAR029268 [Perkinsus marinus ATCC 50983]